MLLPALSNAREKARSISCVNNLKQNALSVMLYANDFNNLIMHHSAGNHFWVNSYGNLTGNQYFQLQTFEEDKNKFDAKMIHCPSAKNSPSEPKDRGNEKSYGMLFGNFINGDGTVNRGREPGRNGFFGDMYISNNRVDLFYDIAKCKSATSFIIFGDSYRSDYNCEWGNANGYNDSNLTYLFILRHKSRINLAMGDGHVESLGRNELQNQDCVISFAFGANHEKLTLNSR